MKWEHIASILRHVLTFGGGFIVAKGWISAEALPGIIGACLTIGGAVWGVVTKTDTALATSIGANANTVVTPSSGGTATVQLLDPSMARAAIQAQNASA